jgi:carboxymethylenebutenolidase
MATKNTKRHKKGKDSQVPFCVFSCFLWLLFFSTFLICGCNAPKATGDVQAVDYPSGKDQVRSLLYRPAGGGPFPAVIAVHEDFGLNDWVKDQATRLSAKGYVVLAADLYRGEVVGNVLDAHIMDRGLPEERALADLRAAVDYLASRPDVRGDRIGIIGWDSGGGYALDAAIQEKRLKAAVICYGRLTTDAKLLEPLNASVLGIFAGKDEGISAETIRQFRGAMDKAGKHIAGLHVYAGCRHGFMNLATLTDPSAAEIEALADAWQKIDGHFAAELK